MKTPAWAVGTDSATKARTTRANRRAMAIATSFNLPTSNQKAAVNRWTLEF
jgi:hypothetical protein